MPESKPLKVLELQGPGGFKGGVMLWVRASYALLRSSLWCR